CPVCSGRSDLLIREPHSHYCNICDGDWSHEGHCLDSLAACCPWCFPKPDAEPLPGARSGPHFHVCAECGQNWRHATGCSAPLRKPRIEAPSPAPDLPPPAPEPAPLAPASDLPKPPAKSSPVKPISSAKPFPPAKPIAPAKPIPPSTVADLPAPRAPVGDRVIEPRAQESRPDE